MSEETTTSNTNASSNGQQPLIRIRSRFPKATPNVAISSGIARIRRLSGHFSGQQQQLSASPHLEDPHETQLHKTPPTTPYHQIMSPLVVHNENSNSSQTNPQITRLYSLSKSPGVASPLVRSSDLEHFSNPATPAAQTFRQYLTSGISSVPMSPAAVALANNSHFLLQAPTTPGGSIYNPKFSTEHIMNIIKYKALQKLKKIESDNLKEKRRKNQIKQTSGGDTLSGAPVDNTTSASLDRSKIRMRDLLYYNTRKSKQQQQQQAQTTAVGPDEIILEENVPTEPAVTSEETLASEYVDESTNGERSLSNDSLESDLTPQQQQGVQMSAAPQLKFAEDGTIIINEESLIIKRVEQEPQFERTIVEESENLDNLNYNSYRKFHHTKKWTKRETAKFYRALSMVGTDFTMIQRFFSHRNRDEIKRKFKREEKLNQALIDRILSTTTKIDLSVFVSGSSDEDDDDAATEQTNQVAVDGEQLDNGEAAATDSKKATKKKLKPRRIRKRAFVESEDENETSTTSKSNKLVRSPPQQPLDESKSNEVLPFKTSLKQTSSSSSMFAQFQLNMMTSTTTSDNNTNQTARLFDETDEANNNLDSDELVLDLDSNKIMSNNSVLMDIEYTETLNKTNPIEDIVNKPQEEEAEEEEEECIILDLDNNTFITNNNRTILNVDDYNSSAVNDNQSINEVKEEQSQQQEELPQRETPVQSKSRIVITRLPKST